MNKMKKISIRITDDELSDIINKAKQKEINPSSYIRLVLDANKEYDVAGQYQQQMILKRELIYEINKIGNNINQITKNNNSELYSNQDKKRLFNELEEIKKLMREIVL